MTTKTKVRGHSRTTTKPTGKWYVDTGSGNNIKRNYFKTEEQAKDFVLKQKQKGERVGYRNEDYDKNTEWKVWWMKGDSTGKLQKRIFDNEISANKFAYLKRQEGYLIGIRAQQKGMGIKK